MKKSTSQQNDYIKDLISLKLRNYREFKSWLATTGIVSTSGQIFKESMTLPLILNRITTHQATEIISALEKLEDVKYSQAYSDEAIQEVSELLQSIQKEVSAWTFTQ